MAILSLEQLGWDDFFAGGFAPYAEESAVRPARVAIEHRSRFVVLGEDGERSAEIAGRFRYDPDVSGGLPAVGDWVVIEPHAETSATIKATLPRRSQFVRRAAGTETRPQTLAANVDIVFIASSLNRELNLRRIERYLVLAWESGASPIVVLTKSDLRDDAEGAADSVRAVAAGVPVHVTSAVTGRGLDGLADHLRGHRTGALLGSSGVGKSTIINRLTGMELLEVRDVRDADDKGRHTTTHRQLVPLPAGGLLIDTPGMRELQLWDAADGVDAAFDDIGEIAASCRFRDCAHEGEPGCAVLAAVAAGALADERLESYKKLRRELRRLELESDPLARALETQRTRAIHRAAQQFYKRHAE